jgi:hypothetical protein
VILAMAAFGYAIGAGLIVALGIDWSWVAVLLGVVVGAIFGIVSVVGYAAVDDVGNIVHEVIVRMMTIAFSNKAENFFVNARQTDF